MKITLKKVTIHKFKCIESDQTYDVEPDTTVLVGMNESGKTSILQALAKTNYFTKDKVFTFNTTHDYPRKEKKRMDKSGKTPKAITCRFGVSEELTNEIDSELGEGVVLPEDIVQFVSYDNKTTMIPPLVDYQAFIKGKTKELRISSNTLNEKLFKVQSVDALQKVIDGYHDENIKEKLNTLKKYFENELKWSYGHPLSEYVARVLLSPHLPKFLYYDEYYALPSRISIEDLQKEKLEAEQQKTAKALFELADINVSEVIGADDFEDFKAELEATEATITEELFNYWSTNTNLEIKFDIDKIEDTHPQHGTKIVEHILDIRVRNNRTKMSLPLRHRSKGFNWFFSFLVWFKKIQEDIESNYVLLLDEPGLNLHASAQKDLLKFIEDLSENYQIIYTTHSPFMMDPQKLNRVRTVLETDNGTKISDSLQEKDPNTLFPLQAALGYDLAQNLFISRHNLLVEGVSDLIYIQMISGLLSGNGRSGLREDIAIVPVGGLEKVSTFVSLLRGSSLNMVCLLDSSIAKGSKAQLENLVTSKIIKQSKILNFDHFVENATEADMEDMFEKDEYIQLFNSAFHEYDNISMEKLIQDIPRIVLQINKLIGVARFNHYRPARELLVSRLKLSEKTLGRFELMFKKINELM